MAAKRCLFWFRKSLRLSDNPALVEALKTSPEHLFPVFCLDPHFAFKMRVGVNRWLFLLESLQDLDTSLKNLGSRLIVVRGNPTEVFPILFKEWKISHLAFERDTEPYAISRDQQIVTLAQEKHKVSVVVTSGHTLWEPEAVVKKNSGRAPLTFTSFVKTVSSLPPPPPPYPAPTKLPSPDASCLTQSLTKLSTTTSKPNIDAKPDNNANHRSADLITVFDKMSGPNKNFDVPSLKELGFEMPQQRSPHRGGETEALKRFEEYFKQKEVVAKFEKPNTSPCAFEPASTTVLSPYLKFGCLGIRTFHSRLHQIYQEIKKHSQPPVSLLGQIYWREMYYTAAYGVGPSYYKMKGNSICLYVNWKCRDGVIDSSDPIATQQLEAWTHGRTGYPFIDAIMTQLRQEGWIHHLARHAVACFLTRGDLYISWERGAEVFEELLLDADPPLNVGNWLWLSASAFFHQYFRVYSPIAFPKKYDPEGKYVKRYIPALKDMPAKYIYEPWKAPLDVQKRAGCVIGKDYPKPIVDHDEARNRCIAGMKASYSRSMHGDHPDVMNDSVQAVTTSTTETKPKKPQAKITSFFGGANSSASTGKKRGFLQDEEEIKGDVPSIDETEDNSKKSKKPKV